MASTNNRYFLVLVIAVVVAGFVLCFSGKFLTRGIKKGDSRMRVCLNGEPFSFDPLYYDAFVHHISAGSSYASLVSQYRAGAFTGIIAESWSSSSDLKVWTFHLRSGLLFDNGDPITSDIVRLSLTRMAFLQHQRHSGSGLTEHLLDIDQINNASDIFAGIQAENDNVILTFTSPQENLLETISFGIYGIVHPGDYDSRTGQWHDSHKLIASGGYSVSSWDDQQIALSLRSNFPTSLRHPYAAQNIIITWDAQDSIQADLIMGSDLDSFFSNHYDFYGPGATSAYIFYVTNYSWNHPDSPVRDKATRMKIRRLFYRQMVKMGIAPVRSFLPLAIDGLREPNEPEVSQESVALNNITIRSLQVSDQVSFRNRVAAGIGQAIEEAGSVYLGVGELSTRQRVDHHNRDFSSYLVDIYPTFTGILVEDPEADVRFMIGSKEGIRLPDPTGRLAIEAAKAKLDLSAINQIIWDDAIVWPVKHFRAGLWSKKGKLDMSWLNLSLPPTDLTLIGFKV